MIKIIDDFFDDPDSVVSLSETMEFSLKNPQWPGVRTQDLRKHAPNVKDMFVKHICDNYPRLNPFELNRDFRSGFQKITSFSKDQYDLKNKGWAHRDTNTLWAGILYLNKNPEPDTGTSAYRVKRGFSHQFADEINIKEMQYRSENVDDAEYDKAYDAMRNQFEETVSIANVYNRFVLFNNVTHHGVQTFGTKPRLTLNFFGMGQYGKIPPVMRSR